MDSTSTPPPSPPTSSTPAETTPSQVTTTQLTPSEQDDLTIKQTQEIELEITTTTPLITPLYPLGPTLLPLYSSDPIYTSKLNTICASFSKIRRTRPDGNCFYRAVLFRLFEVGSEGLEFHAKLEEKWKGWKEVLVEAGYTQFTVEDFYDHFGESLATLTTPSPDITTLYFTTPATCDYLTVFLRILTAAELTRNAAFYSNFLTTAPTIEEFTKLEVEPMGKEADHLQISALAAVLGVGIKIIYMDRGEDSSIVEHLFPEGELDYPIVLLYRPGHYDLVY